MKPSLFSRTLVGALLITGLGSVAHATSLGYENSPLGGGESHAFWDSFTSINFTNATPGEAQGGLFTATLSSTMTAGSVPSAGAGDRIYGGSGASGVPITMSIAVTAAADFTTFSLQIKHTAPSSGIWADYFTIGTIDGISAVQSFVSNSNEGSQTNFNIYQWTWTGLDVKAGESFEITIAGPGAHVSLDGLRVDASAVPEPSTYAAIFGGLALVGAVGRRRLKRVAA